MSTNVTDEKKSTRYPYTYAADCVRSLAGYGPEGTKLSRADASRLYSEIACILGIPTVEIANKIADYYLVEHLHPYHHHRKQHQE